jgi:hypothetical protein
LEIENDLKCAIENFWQDDSIVTSMIDFGYNEEDNNSHNEQAIYLLSSSKFDLNLSDGGHHSHAVCLIYNYYGEG